MFWVYLIGFFVLVIAAFIVFLSYASKKRMQEFEKLDTFSQQAVISKLKSVGISTEKFEFVASKKTQDDPTQLFDTALLLFYTGQNYEQVLEIFTSLAEQGNADAIYFLGELHVGGRGVVEYNELKAQQYYLQAAEMGQACAQYTWAKQILVEHLMEGLTAAQMEEAKQKALDFMHKAAEQKNGEACFWLAMQYLQGTYGLAVNYQKAHDLLAVLAAQKTLLGVPLQPTDLKATMGSFEPQIAQYILGLYHISKLSGAVDYSKAVDYFKQAIGSEHPEASALYALAKVYDENKLGLASAQAKPLAYSYYQKACQRLSGEIDHLSAIGWYYKPDVGREKAPAKIEQAKYDEPTSPDSSLEEIEKLAKEGKPKSQFILGRMYLQGNKTDKNEAKAREWLEKAALQGHAEAQWQLALLLPEQDKALPWLKKAADQMIVSYMAVSILKDYGFTCLEQGFIPQGKAQEEPAQAQTIKPTVLTSSMAETYIKQYIELKNHDVKDEEDSEKNEADIKDCLNKLSKESHPEIYFYLAVEHYSCCEYEEAFQALQRAREQGSKHCFYLLGRMHEYGEAVEQDDDKSEQYLEQGAKLGCCYAQYSRHWFSDTNNYLEAAAKQNHFAAIEQLAENYEKGQNGYPLDYDKAYEWYSYLIETKKTTLSEFDYGFYYGGLVGLANMYLKGEGREQSFQKAAEYFEKTPNSDNLYAAANLYYGEFIAIPKQIALEKSAKLYEGICEHLFKHKGWDLESELEEAGESDEEIEYKAKLTSYDEGTTPNSSLEELLVWAKKGYCKSQYNVAMCYADLKQPNYDQDKAAYWLTQAAESDHEKAIFELGKHYIHVKKDAVKACELLKPLTDELIDKFYNHSDYMTPTQLLTIEELKKIQNAISN